LIDRLRRDIQNRLEQLLAEADKLRRALGALDARRGANSPSRSTTPAPARQTRRRPQRPAAKPKASPASPRVRAAIGATKAAVLETLATNGSAMTAGDVAAVTGLGRATVSATLSKLTQTGDVVKAERGYRLPRSAAQTSAPTANESVQGDTA